MLIRQCLTESKNLQIPTYLSAFPGTCDFYAKMGFDIVETAGIDLANWETEFRGYGVYKSYGMLYQPVEGG